MAVRGPQRPAPTPLKPVDKKGGEAQLSTIERGLLASGIASTPQEAKKIARTLLAALRGKGVPANTLPLAVKQFQKQNGLKQTGQLDDKTVKLMQKQGLLPAGDKPGGRPAPGKVGAQPAAPTAPGAKPGGDVVARGPVPSSTVGQPAATPRPLGSQGRPTGESGHVVTIDQTRALSEHMQVPDSMKGGPAELLENLATLGFFGGGKGAEQLREAVRAFQRSVGLATSGKIDPDTAAAMKDKGVLPSDAKAGQNASEGRPTGQEGQGTSAATGERASSSASEQARTQVDRAAADPHARGVPERTDDEKARGRAADGEGEAKRKGKGGQGAGDEEGEGALDEGDEDGTEEHDANSPAGDEDLADERRGHATLDEEEADAGYYEVGPLSQQLAAALEEIERDDDGRGPVTYRWDVTFYRPGVYGAHQPAEPLWHIGIEQVTAFDEVWQQACDALAVRMRKTEPDRPQPTFADFERALRRARARSTP